MQHFRTLVMGAPPPRCSRRKSSCLLGTTLCGHALRGHGEQAAVATAEERTARGSAAPGCSRPEATLPLSFRAGRVAMPASGSLICQQTSSSWSRGMVRHGTGAARQLGWAPARRFAHRHVYAPLPAQCLATSVRLSWSSTTPTQSSRWVARRRAGWQHTRVSQDRVKQAAKAPQVRLQAT